VTATRTTGQSIIWAHCNECGDRRRHELLHMAQSQWEEEIDHDFTISGRDVYEMLRCCGCEHICLRHRMWFSEAWPEEEPEERYYPPVVSRRKPDWLNKFRRPNFILEILEEIYEALHANSRRLAGMGTRSLVEHIMVDKVGDHGCFSKTINSFCEEGYITSIQKDRLATVLDLGHASVHREFKPEPEDLRTALDIVESLIADIYVHPDRAKRLAERVPGRKKLLPTKEVDGR
jgi:hypothetical protein